MVRDEPREKGAHRQRHSLSGGMRRPFKVSRLFCKLQGLLRVIRCYIHALKLHKILYRGVRNPEKGGARRREEGSQLSSGSRSLHDLT